MEQLRMTLMRKQIWVTCIFIFITDIVMGMLLPSFSTYAQELGAPLTLIGLLGMSIGLARILGSLPMGMVSDARGRRTVIATGALILATAAVLHTIVPAPTSLIPVRALIGIGMTATFPIGAAHLGDVIPLEQQSIAIGLYYASMGLGFAIGPVLAGTVISTHGYAASYWLAALLALVGFAIAVLGLSGPTLRSQPSRRTSPQRKSSDCPLSARLSGLRCSPDVLATSIANLLVAAAFHGAIISFLPLLAASLSISGPTFGLLFSVRTLVSTTARLVAGFLNARFPSRFVIVGTLMLLSGAHLSASYTDSLAGLAACMIGEGVAYGIFVTSGQDLVIKQSCDIDRGTLVGLYGMLGSIGSTLGPAALGLVADTWGLEAVFRSSATVLSAGVFAILTLSHRRGQQSEGPTVPLPSPNQQDCSVRLDERSHDRTNHR